MGYPFDMFTPNPFLQKLACVICQDILQDPQLSPCQHRFCKKCIVASLRVKLVCPVCRAVLRACQLRDDVTANSFVMDFEVTCSNTGCCWKGPMSNLSDHNNTCDYAVVPCENTSNGCDVRGLKKDVVQHQQDCPYREVPCPHCQQSEIFKYLEPHISKDCLEFVVNCPNGCEHDIKRKDFEEHVKDICPLVVVDCEYVDHGCKELIARQDINKHNQEFMEKHLKLLKSSFAKLQDEKAHIEDQNRSSKRKLKLVKQELNSVKRRCLDPLLVTVSQWVYEFQDLLSAHNNGENISTPKFSAFGQEWHLDLYPNGVLPEYDKSISLYLSKHGNNDMTVTFSVTLVNQYNPTCSLCLTSESRRFDKEFPSFGWEQFISQEDLQGDQGYCVENCVALEVELIKVVTNGNKLTAECDEYDECEAHEEHEDFGGD